MLIQQDRQMMILKKKQNGMTLIEIMVAVAIVAIIASVAIPSFQRQSLKGKRADGMAILMDAAARQERHIIDHNEYASTMAALKFPADGLSDKGYYKVAIVLSSPTEFKMTAVAQGGQADDACKNLVIDSTGKRSSSAGATKKCW